MFVRSRMTEKVVTTTPQANLREVLTVMKQHNFEGLPVVDDNKKLVGIITVWDIHEALTKSVLNGGELGAGTLVADIMSHKVVTVLPEEIIEEAAYVMEANDLWVLPVVSQEEQLVGIITESDIYDVFVEMLGLKQPGTRITLRVEDKPGKLAEIVQLVKAHQVSIISIATFQPDQNYRNIVLRLKTPEVRRLVADLRQKGLRVLHVSQVWE